MVVIIDPKDLDNLWQKAGRVGRDRTQVKSPKVIVYIPVNKMTAALEFMCTQSLPHLASTTLKTGASCSKKRKHTFGNNNNSGVSDIDLGLAYVITSKCLPSTINDKYNNPTEDLKCSPECTTCTQIGPILTPENPCNCSGCAPEDDAHLKGTSMNPAIRKKMLPLNLCVKKDMHLVGLTILKHFQQDLW